MAIDQSTRSSLLTSMIEQLQSDRDAARAADNAGAAVAASKAIADLLALKMAPETADNQQVGVSVRRFIDVPQQAFDRILGLVRRISELEQDGAADDELRERAQAVFDDCFDGRPAGEGHIGIDGQDRPIPDPATTHNSRRASEITAADIALGERLLALFPRDEIDRIMDETR